MWLGCVCDVEGSTCRHEVLARSEDSQADEFCRVIKEKIVSLARDLLSSLSS